MARSGCFSRRLGAAVRELGGAWYGRHMAAAERAIVDRLSIVDLILEIRDARIPITSAFGSLKRWFGSRKHVVVLNKVDLADRSSTEEWMKHIRQQGCACCAVNAHKKDSIRELLAVLRGKIRELKSGEDCTATVMLVGIPNVGKSAIVNSLHEIGRIHAEEKGRLRHAVVSTYPSETKDITAYKIQSHPSIYILDSPGILSPKVATDDYASKLTLTGAIKDSTLQDTGLVEFFLSVLIFSDKYNNWEDSNDIAELVSQKRSRQYPSDHTNDVIVKDVRRILAKTRRSFNGNLKEEDELKRLVESQLVALQEPFGLHCGLVGDRNKVVASKLLDLYWTGRLGHYTLDTFSKDL